MAYIPVIEPLEAEGLLRQTYAQAERRSGRVFNILKIMSHSPQALRASMDFYLAIMRGKSHLSRAQREMLATVVSATNRCHYWTEAHGADFRDEVQDDELAEALKSDWREAGLTEADRALCGWAEKLTRDPHSATQADVTKLQATGFCPEAISDTAQIVGYFNYINRIADGLGVDLEKEMPPAP